MHPRSHCVHGVFADRLYFLGGARMSSLSFPHLPDNLSLRPLQAVIDGGK